MSLFDGIPLDYEEPAKTEAPASKPVELQWLISVCRASNGQEILVCNITPPPAAAIEEAAKRGLALFVLDEIQAIRRAAADGGSHAVDLIIETRRVMGYGGPIEYKAVS